VPKLGEIAPSLAWPECTVFRRLVLDVESGLCEPCGAARHVCDHRFHRIHILRRVERVRQLLEARTELSLAEDAAHAGFSDQSQFSHHFKRIVGFTPGQFRTRVRTA
jgi:AraC-like DNA-binding protein